MKYIPKPEAVKVDPLPPFTFDLFVKFIVNNDRQFNAAGPGIRAGLRIEDALAKAECKPFVELDADLWKMLRDGAENPTALNGQPVGYPALRNPNGQIVKSIALTGGDALPAAFAGSPIAASTLTPAQQTTLRQLLGAVRAQAATELGFVQT